VVEEDRSARQIASKVSFPPSLAARRSARGPVDPREERCSFSHGPARTEERCRSGRSRPSAPWATSAAAPEVDLVHGSPCRAPGGCLPQSEERQGRESPCRGAAAVRRQFAGEAPPKQARPETFLPGANRSGIQVSVEGRRSEPRLGRRCDRDPETDHPHDGSRGAPPLSRRWSRALCAPRGLRSSGVAGRGTHLQDPGRRRGHRGRRGRAPRGPIPLRRTGIVIPDSRATTSLDIDFDLPGPRLLVDERWPRRLDVWRFDIGIRRLDRRRHGRAARRSRLRSGRGDEAARVSPPSSTSRSPLEARRGEPRELVGRLHARRALRHGSPGAGRAIGLLRADLRDLLGLVLGRPAGKGCSHAAARSLPDRSTRIDGRAWTSRSPRRQDGMLRTGGSSRPGPTVPRLDRRARAGQPPKARGRRTGCSPIPTSRCSVSTRFDARRIVCPRAHRPGGTTATRATRAARLPARDRHRSPSSATCSCRGTHFLIRSRSRTGSSGRGLAVPGRPLTDRLTLPGPVRLKEPVLDQRAHTIGRAAGGGGGGGWGAGVGGVWGGNS